MTLDEIRDKFTTEATNLYVVINSDGHYFRRKGYGGYGDTWVASMNTARVYAKLSQARSVVTFFANSYPQYPAPKIVRLQVTPVEILDESERVARRNADRQKAKARHNAWTKEQQFQRAQQELKAAQQRVNELNELS